MRNRLFKKATLDDVFASLNGMNVFLYELGILNSAMLVIKVLFFAYFVVYCDY